MKIKTLLPFIRTKFAYIQPWLADATLLFARLTIGWSFFLTGKGKLANLERTTGFFESLGIPAPAFHAAFVGGVEMIGGLLLLAGLMSRAAAVPLAGTMIVAYLTAHREDAFQSLGSMVDETPYAYLIVCMFVLAFGPGRIALDRLLFRKGCSGKACEQGNRK
jgi:putative oxidoreductase